MSTGQSISEFLASLEKEKADHASTIKELQAKMAEIDRLIPGIQARLTKSTEAHRPMEAKRLTPPREGQPAMLPFTGLSLRKALLKLLAGRGIGAVMKTAEIVPALSAGGVQSKAQSFASNVSATLSVMQSKHGEVEWTNGGWAITDVGAARAAGT